MNLLDREDRLLRGIDRRGELHNFRLYRRDTLKVSLERIDHRSQYVRCLSHIGQRYVFQRLPDPGGAVAADVIFSFQDLESVGKVQRPA